MQLILLICIILTFLFGWFVVVPVLIAAAGLLAKILAVILFFIVLGIIGGIWLSR